MSEEIEFSEKEKEKIKAWADEHSVSPKELEDFINDIAGDEIEEIYKTFGRAAVNLAAVIKSIIQVRDANRNDDGSLKGMTVSPDFLDQLGGLADEVMTHVDVPVEVGNTVIKVEGPVGAPVDPKDPSMAN